MLQSMEVYVFVQRHGMSDHNYMFNRRFAGVQAIARESGQSAMLLPDDPPGTISPFAYTHGADPVEREGELVRRAKSPHHCSRMGGVFAFADKETCRYVSSRFGWDLSEVRAGIGYGRLFETDMMISSLLADGTIDLPAAMRQRLWEQYWSGQSLISTNYWKPFVPLQLHPDRPVWEWLVDGHVQFDVEDNPPFNL